MAGSERQGPETERSKVSRRAWGFVLVVFAASRLFYLLAGALLVNVMPIHPFQQQSLDVPFGTLSIWAHFDGERYVSIAESGYDETLSFSSRYLASPAFFPLYPLLMRSVAALCGGPISPGGLSVYGVLLSLVAFCIALYFVYRIAEDGWGTRAAQGTVLTLAFFPTSFFLNAVYTESLFLALSAGSLWAARVRRDLLLACALAAFATATRNVGVFLIAPLAYEWLKGGAGRYGLWRGAACLALAPSGLLCYAAYLWLRFGDPFLFYTQQGRWDREATGPLTTLSQILTKAGEGIRMFFDPQIWGDSSLRGIADRLAAAHNAYDMLFLGLALALVVAGVGGLALHPDAHPLLMVLPAAF